MNTRLQALHAGVMIPQNNTTVERELPLWLPPGSSIDLVRIPRGQGLFTADTLPAYVASALDLARQFARDDIDVVAYSCTAAGFILGPEGDRKLTAELQRVTTKPVSTIAHSMVQALLALRVKRIGMVTPYSDAVNEQLKAFIVDGGIEVIAFDSLYAANVDELGRITADAVAGIARKTMTDGCEAMYIACAQLPTFEILDGLAAEFGRPVLSSIQSLAAQITSLATRRAAAAGALA